MINIFLADDHQIVRKGFKALLSSEPDFNVVGEANDGLETIRLVEQLQPDVLVLDLMMGGLNGLEVTRQLSKKNPKTGIVILSMHSNEAYVLEALRSGAKAYILKESPPEDLIQAVRQVYAGKQFLSSPLNQRAIEAYTSKIDAKPINPYDQLTTREREILQLTAQGATNAEIAARLFISPRTVETHRTNLMRKLNLHNHNQLIQFAIQNDIIPGKI
jgi:two-component system, NarL family, response regulator NreC